MVDKIVEHLAGVYQRSTVAAAASPIDAGKILVPHRSSRRARRVRAVCATKLLGERASSVSVLSACSGASTARFWCVPLFSLSVDCVVRGGGVADECGADLCVVMFPKSVVTVPQVRVLRKMQTLC